jgi:hypothetical protein
VQPCPVGAVAFEMVSAAHKDRSEDHIEDRRE